MKKKNTQKLERGYGTWPSPLTAEMLATGSDRISQIKQIGTETFWVASRAAEKGRSVLVRCDGEGNKEDLLPSPWSCRSRVHEYGGGAWWPGKGCLFFSEASDNQIYRISGTEQPTAVSAANTQWRYADGCSHPQEEWFVCIREDHTSSPEPENTIVAFVRDNPDPIVIVSGADFYSNPRISPDGRRLSWIQWDHPNMSWDEAQVCVANISSTGAIEPEHTVIAGGNKTAPQCSDWHSSGVLLFCDDRSGCWHMYSWDPETSETRCLTASVTGEIGYPQWKFNLQRWVETADGHCVAILTKNATDTLVTVDLEGNVQDIAFPYCQISSLTATSSGSVIVLAASPTESDTILELQAGSGEWGTFVESPSLGFSPDSYSKAKEISFESVDGQESFAFFYPPHSLEYCAPEEELPPLIVMSHGGPTGHTSPSLNHKIQYWTSRGFAVVDVNYAGSSGYGRSYRSRLNGQWGVLDVEDCIRVAELLSSEKKVDKQRLVIRGSSAGGLTTLGALIQSDIFSAGTVLYGVSDLQGLAAETHKFESRYFDTLVAPYPAQKEIYEERSPINNVESIESPLLLLQGANDKVVPPAQSESIAAALQAKGIPTVYECFEGEQHGFRQAENIIRSLELELWFYGTILGFTPADQIEKVAGLL